MNVFDIESAVVFLLLIASVMYLLRRWGKSFRSISAQHPDNTKSAGQCSHCSCEKNKGRSLGPYRSKRENTVFAVLRDLLKFCRGNGAQEVIQVLGILHIGKQADITRETLTPGIARRS